MLSSYSGGSNKSTLMEVKLKCIKAATQIISTTAVHINQQKQPFWGRKACTYNYHQHYWTQVDDEEEEEDHC